MMRPVGADFQRMERHAQVVDRARERGEVVDEVDLPVDVDVLGHVVVEELEALAAQVRDVLQRPGVEVVDADDSEAVLDQVVAEVRAEETGAAGDDRGWHRRDATHRPQRRPQTLRGLYRDE